MSLNDLSEASGLTPSQISQIERGNRPEPGFRTIARLAKGLKVSMDDLAAAVGLADAAFGKTLAGSAREVLALRRELETIKGEALRLAERAEKALSSPPDAKRAKRKR